MLFKKKKPKDAPADGAESDAAAAAAPTAEGDAAEGEAAPKKGGKKKLIMIAAGALVVVGAGGATAFVFLGPKAGGKAEAHGEKGDHAKRKGGHKKAKKGGGEHGGGKPAGGATITEGPEGVVYYTMPDMVVNIQSPDGRPTYLKLKLTLELPDHESAEALSAAGPRLNDMFSTFLRELRPEDLSGSQGTYQLRQEILRRVNLVAAPNEVNAVLIEEMLIQG